MKEFYFKDIKKMYSDNNFVIYEDNEGDLWINKNNIENLMKFRRKAISQGVMNSKEYFNDLYKKLGIEIEIESLVPEGIMAVLNNFNNKPSILIRFIDLFNYIVIDIDVSNHPIWYKVELGVDEKNVPYVKSKEVIKH